MHSVRFVCSLGQKYVTTVLPFNVLSSGLNKYSGTVTLITMRRLSTLEITKNLELITKDKIPTNAGTSLKLAEPQNKPLVIMLSWMLAKRKHVYKFADYYVNYGFDVLRVSMTPWQLLWPTKGTQVIARDVLTFLDLNASYVPLLIHGFSVGGYQWGEVLVHIANEQKRYQPIADRIVGQIWDSAADLSEVWFGFPMAVFPKNLMLQNAMKQYMLYHLKAFDKVATCHYVRASQIFHSDLVKAPALMLISKSDPVGAEKSNLRLKENWERLGMKVYWKCWDRSPHVSHFHFHREEYLEQLDNFLGDIGLIPVQKKMQAKL